jgi:hypothetical protein
MPTISTSQIRIPIQRQRTTNDKDFDKYIEQLAESIRLIGLINPITIDETNALVAGFCRLKAFELLGRQEIEYTLQSDLEPWQREVMEFEENYRRKNLTPAEELLAVKKIHTTYQQLHGTAKTLTGHGRPVWTMEDTASLLGIANKGTVSQQITLAEAIEREPDLAKLGSVSSIKNEVDRRQLSKIRSTLAMISIASTPKQDETSIPTPNFPVPFYSNQFTKLYNDDCLKIIPFIPDESLDSLITDPPWQVDHDEKTGTDPYIGLELTERMLKALYPKLKDGAICWMFCATRHLINGVIYQLVLRCGYQMSDRIKIWYKPGLANMFNVHQEIRNDYEPIVLFSKGMRRPFVHQLWAITSALLDHKPYHPQEKPLAMIEPLITSSTVEFEQVIDPFAGSGVVGLCAQKLGRRAILIDDKEDFCRLITSQIGV